MKLPALKNKRVLIRVDYNVPIKDGKVVDPNRIEASYNTIDQVLKKGGAPILIAHLGKSSETLRPIATFLSKKYKIVFITEDILSDKIKDIISVVPKGTIILLENIRRYEGEELNDKSFAKKLSTLGDYFINDAFSVSHRKHASVVGVAKYIPSFMGAQLELEIKSLKRAIENKKHPFVFILGGAKFETKVPLLNQFAKKADKIVIAGALLNNFYMVSGFEVGKSVVETGYEKPIKKLLKDPKILLPVDVIVIRGDKNVIVTPLEVQKNDVIVDIGPRSVELISFEIKNSKLIVWNGPTGWYEKGFTKATIALAKAITQSSALSIIGGGDTGAVVNKMLGKQANSKKNNKIFVSTGGGATLDYLSHGKLPGIDSLKS